MNYLPFTKVTCHSCRVRNMICMILEALIWICLVVGLVLCWSQCHAGRTTEATLEANSSTSQAETELVKAETNISSPQEAIAQELKNLRSLGCEPTVISIKVLKELRPKDELVDKPYIPYKVTARRCLQSCSFCESKGHICVSSMTAVKEFALQYLENGENHTRWREIKEDIACECRPGVPSDSLC
ncbi:uncharacterized protein LOC122259921 [Penaeus japonicus]|uniref:uncharacterized protein LOC122259921 n=1 Tax=Penaeus japonicus TaxID=27405 RepID=UPI001C716305|nr:uncharacterized protein LOC122259921 [Penaeus japonicus]